MLFLAQSDDQRLEEIALAECSKYGFEEIEFSDFGRLKVDVLNTDQCRGFAGFHEEALDEGSALVCYPNRARCADLLDGAAKFMVIVIKGLHANDGFDASQGSA